MFREAMVVIATAVLVAIVLFIMISFSQQDLKNERFRSSDSTLTDVGASLTCNSLAQQIRQYAPMCMASSDFLESLAIRGLVGYWPLLHDDSDHSGYGHHPSRNTARLHDGEGHYFDGGSRSRMTISHSKLFEPNGNSLSFGCWFKPTHNTNTHNRYPMIMWSGSRDGSWYLQYQGGQAGFRVQGRSGSGQVARTGAHISQGTWYHLFVVYNREERTVKMFQDGKHVHTSSGVLADRSVNSNLEIGYWGGNQKAQGYINHARVYNRALHDREVADLHRFGI